PRVEPTVRTRVRRRIASTLAAIRDGALRGVDEVVLVLGARVHDERAARERERDSKPSAHQNLPPTSAAQPSLVHAALADVSSPGRTKVKITPAAARAKPPKSRPSVTFASRCASSARGAKAAGQ